MRISSNPFPASSRTRAGRDHHGFLVEGEIGQHPDDETLGIFDRQPDGHIKSALRLADDDAGDRVQTFIEDVAPPLVFLANGLEVAHAHFICGDRGLLLDRRRAEPRLGEFQGGLIDALVPGDDGADPRPAAAESLGDRVHDDDPVLGFLEFQDALMRQAVVDEFLVDFVADEKEVVFLWPGRNDAAEFFGRIDRARRVVGRTEEDGFRPGRDFRFDRLVAGGSR